MKKLLLIFLIILPSSIISQVPESPMNPMTAPGARGIDWTNHTLFWKNPGNVVYNEVYFSTDSALVSNSDLSVRILNGSPSTIFSSAPLSTYGNLNPNTKYFWKVVEHNSNGNSNSPVWYFYSQASPAFLNTSSFDTGLEGWQFFGPNGITNWYWSNTSAAGGLPGELAFRWDPVFIGESYFISPELISPAGLTTLIEFRYYEDWWSDTVVVGCALTSDNGSTWSTIWDLHATANSGPELISTSVEAPGNFRLGFYYTGNSNNIDFYFIDDVWIATPITPTESPTFLSAVANDSVQKVSLNWVASSGNPFITGFSIQRKSGLPAAINEYTTIASTDNNTLFYDDYDVQLNQIYTYRVRSLASTNSHYGNEATAYVPAVIPVELISFNTMVDGNNINLHWITATETNNSGFQVERREQKKESSEEWKNIGFVSGKGTTTELKSYFYKDENLNAGKYHYRLKQIDFDGTFEYSNIVEAEILPPTRFSLKQNYPNPFNPTTSIQFTLSSKEFVTLKIFNLLGKEIATLVNEERQVGNHRIDFNASDLSSGIYYYRIVAGKFSDTKKMVLIK